MLIEEQLLKEGDRFTLYTSQIDDEDVYKWYIEHNCPVLTVSSIDGDLVWTTDYDCPYVLNISYISKEYLDDVIMDEIHFSFTRNGVKYNVNVEAQYEVEGNDQYYVSVHGFKPHGVGYIEEYNNYFYVDSNGNLSDDYVDNDLILDRVYNFLFRQAQQSIVKGF